MWKTEKEFGQYIMAKLSKEGAKCIRIESASTISGMPDMYLMGLADDYFIEFKNMKDKSIKDACWKIPWRPGQQGWALDYYDRHSKQYSEAFVKSKHTWTFVGLKDGVLLIRMTVYRKDNVIYASDYFTFVFSKENLTKLKLSWFLKTYTYVIKPFIHEGDTWYTYLQNWSTYILNECFGGAYSYDIDMPTPEEYIDDITAIVPEVSVEKLDMLPYIEGENKISGLKKIGKYLSEMVASIYNSYLNI